MPPTTDGRITVDGFISWVLVLISWALLFWHFVPLILLNISAFLHKRTGGNRVMHGINLGTPVHNLSQFSDTSNVASATKSPKRHEYRARDGP